MQGGETPVPFLLQDITSSRQLIAEITRLDHENSRLTGTIVDLNEELKQARADSQAVAENRRLKERLKDADGECHRISRGFEHEFDCTLASRDSQIRTIQRELAHTRVDLDKETWKLRNQLGRATSHDMENQRLRDELTKALAHHEVEIRRLKDELETARAGYADDDDLVKLYHAGTGLFERQAVEVKGLKAELQRGKDEQEQREREFTLAMTAKDTHLATLLENIRHLEDRLSSLNIEYTDSETDLKKRMASSQDQFKAAIDLNKKLKNDMLECSKMVEEYRQRKPVEDKDGDMFGKLERQCEGYRKTAVDQQKLIEQLSKENTKLVRDCGKHHGYKDH
jgi:chromosome segregation ATPase